MDNWDTEIFRLDWRVACSVGMFGFVIIILVFFCTCVMLLFEMGYWMGGDDDIVETILSLCLLGATLDGWPE